MLTNIIIPLILGYGLILSIILIFGYFNNPKDILIWVLYDFSGIRLICERIFPPKLDIKNYRKPSSFLVWCIGLYFALYGISIQRYENALNQNQIQINSIFSQLSTNDWKSAISRIPSIQKKKYPFKPDMIKPISVFRSLFVSGQFDADIIDLTNRIIESKKNDLSGISLKGVILKNVDLSEANLNKADLSNAEINNSNFKFSSFKSAKLKNVTIRNSNLCNTDFSNSILNGSRINYCSFSNTYFHNSSIINTDFSGSFFWMCDFSSSYCDSTNFLDILNLNEKQKAEIGVINQLYEGKYISPESRTDTALQFAELISKAKTLHNSNFELEILEIIKNIGPPTIFDIPKLEAPKNVEIRVFPSE